MFQARVDVVVDHRSLLVAAEVVRSVLQDEVCAGVHTQLVEKMLQVDGGAILGNTRDELLHIRLELIQSRDQGLVEIRAENGTGVLPEGSICGEDALAAEPEYEILTEFFNAPAFRLGQLEF